MILGLFFNFRSRRTVNRLAKQLGLNMGKITKLEYLMLQIFFAMDFVRRNNKNILHKNEYLVADGAINLFYLLNLRVQSSFDDLEEWDDFSDVLISAFSKFLPKYVSISPLVVDGMIANRVYFFNELLPNAKSIIEEMEYILYTDYAEKDYVSYSSESPMCIPQMVERTCLVKYLGDLLTEVECLEPAIKSLCPHKTPEPSPHTEVRTSTATNKNDNRKTNAIAKPLGKAKLSIGITLVVIQLMSVVGSMKFNTAPWDTYALFQGSLAQVAYDIVFLVSYFLVGIVGVVLIVLALPRKGRYPKKPLVLGLCVIVALLLLVLTYEAPDTAVTSIPTNTPAVPTVSFSSDSEEISEFEALVRKYTSSEPSQEPESTSPIDWDDARAQYAARDDITIDWDNLFEQQAEKSIESSQR